MIVWTPERLCPLCTAKPKRLITSSFWSGPILATAASSVVYVLLYVAAAPCYSPFSPCPTGSHTR